MLGLHGYIGIYREQGFLGIRVPQSQGPLQVGAARGLCKFGAFSGGRFFGKAPSCRLLQQLLKDMLQVAAF